MSATPRWQRVAEMTREGKSAREIAAALGDRATTNSVYVLRAYARDRGVDCPKQDIPRAPNPGRRSISVSRKAYDRLVAEADARDVSIASLVEEYINAKPFEVPAGMKRNNPTATVSRSQRRELAAQARAERRAEGED